MIIVLFQVFLGHCPPLHFVNNHPFLLGFKTCHPRVAMQYYFMIIFILLYWQSYPFLIPHFVYFYFSFIRPVKDLFVSLFVPLLFCFCSFQSFYSSSPLCSSNFLTQVIPLQAFKTQIQLSLYPIGFDVKWSLFHCLCDCVCNFPFNFVFDLTAIQECFPLGHILILTVR